MVGKASLLLVIGFATILLILGFQLNQHATRAVTNMSAYNESTESHNLALAGANAGMSVIYADSNWRGPLTQTVGPNSYRVQVYDLSTTADLISVSTYHTPFTVLHDTVRVTLTKTKKNSFTLYAWLTEFEGNYFWRTGDTVRGKLHTNGRLHINGSPVFYGKVTLSKGFDPPRVGIGTNRAVIKDTYETGVAPISFPSDISEITTASTSGGRAYTGEIWVEMKSTGMVYVRTAAGGPVVDSVSTSAAGFNGVIASTGRVNVEGVLSGKLTISSATDVRITNDVTYNSRTTDLLGLVAQNNVMVGNTTANQNGINIDACIFANTGTFGAEGTVNGRVNVFGSITQRNRSAPFGTSRSITYDERLEDNDFRPPYFPGYYTKTLAIQNWWESYRVLIPL